MSQPYSDPSYVEPVRESSPPAPLGFSWGKKKLGYYFRWKSTRRSLTIAANGRWVTYLGKRWMYHGSLYHHGGR